MAEKEASRVEIKLVGFGGQGIILAGRILGRAATLYSRKYATLAQSYGPEARGGACCAEVVIASEPIDYPYTTTPQILVIMSQEGWEKYCTELVEGGIILTDMDLVDTSNVKGAARKAKKYSIPATRLAEKLGRKIVANMVMLGYLIAVTGVVEKAAMEAAIADSVPRGTEKFNIEAFNAGYVYGKSKG